MPLGYEGDKCIWSYDRYTKEGAHFEGGYILGAVLCAEHKGGGAPVQRGPSGDRLRLAEARGLWRREPPMRPLAEVVSCLAFLIGAAVEDQLVELWQWPKDISKTDQESGFEGRLKPKGPKDDWLGFTWFGGFDICK